MPAATGLNKTSWCYGVAKQDGQYFPAKWAAADPGKKINLAGGNTLYATHALAYAAGQALNITDENGNTPRAFRTPEFE